MALLYFLDGGMPLVLRDYDGVDSEVAGPELDTSSEKSEGRLLL